MYELEMLVNKMKCLDVEILQEPNNRVPMFCVMRKFPSSFWNCPEKINYSWLKRLSIFNITLSPLEQNLFPYSAHPQTLFLPPIGSFRSCLKRFTAGTLYSKFCPRVGRERGMALEATGLWSRDTPPRWVRGLVSGGSSPLLDCVLQTW